jgi:hypothetical protein
MGFLDSVTDKFGFLGKGNTSVGNDVVAGKNTTRMDKSVSVPGLNQIQRRSLDTEGSQGEFLTDKLEQFKSETYQARGTSGNAQSSEDSKLTLDVESRQNEQYVRGDSLEAPRNIENKFNKTKHSVTTEFPEGLSAKSFDDFKKTYDVSLEKLKIKREPGMLNNIKEKKVLNLLAAGRGDMITAFAEGDPTKSSTDDAAYYANIAKTHGKRYEHNEYSLDSKKFPNYSSPEQSKRIDSFNTRGPTDNNLQSEYEFRSEDMIPLYFHDLVNKKFIPFRSIIDGVSESSSAEWNEVKYLGRADKVHIYTGFTRTLSIEITAVAFSVEELHPMWQRINYLVGLTMPAGYTSDVEENSTSSFIIPPFVKFRLGDLYKNQPVVIKDVQTSIPAEATWELMTNDHTRNKNNYDYMNGTVVRDNVRSAQYPTMAKLSVSMTLLEKRAPQTQSRHFGDSTPENNPNTPDQSIPTGDFNHQLIHFDEPVESSPQSGETVDQATKNTSGTSSESEVTGPPTNSQPERQQTLMSDLLRDAGGSF